MHHSFHGHSTHLSNFIFPSQLAILTDALHARSNSFLGAASLPRHLRRRATSHAPRDRRAKRPNAKRTKIINGAGFEADATKSPYSSKYHFALNKGIAVCWCRNARRRPERVRLANRERLLLGEENKNDDDDKMDSEPAEIVASVENVCMGIQSESTSRVVSKLRSDTNWRRLETHTWHAKRFQMTQLWGWKLPLGRPGKGHGYRSVIKRTKKNAVAHDGSYHASFVLSSQGCDGSGGSEVLLQIIQSACVTSIPSKRLRSESFASGKIALDGVLRDENNRVVSPAEFFTCVDGDGMGKQSGDDTKNKTHCVFVWVHASARDEAFEMFQKLCAKHSGTKVQSAFGRLCRFEICGNDAERVLETLVGNSAVLREKDGGVTPRGVVSVMTGSTGGILQDCSVFARVAREVIDEKNDDSSLKPFHSEKGYPLTIFRRVRPASGMLGNCDAGYTVFGDISQTKNLWGKITHANVTVLGVREWRWLASGSGCASFPTDYLDSQAAQDEVANKVDQIKRRATSVPKGKRVADTKMEDVVKAGVDFCRQKKKLTRVVITCPRGGCPTPGAAVLVPTSAQKSSVCPNQSKSITVKTFDAFDKVFGKPTKTKNRKSLAAESDAQEILGYVTSCTPASESRGMASAVVDVTSEYLASVFEKWNLKNKSYGQLVVPVALSVPTAEPSAIVPAAMQVFENENAWW